MPFTPFAPAGGGGGAVSSVFGRAGAVTAQAGDYSVGLVTGAAPLASPVFTGTPTAPTASLGTNTLQVATTAFTQAAINGLAPLVSPVFAGVPTAPTAAFGTSTAQLATTAFVQVALAGKVTWLLPSGDVTGAADAAAIQAAYVALGGAPGIIKLAPVAPWYLKSGIVVITTPAVYVDTAGCFINQTGAGAGIDMSQPTSSRAVNGGGVIGNGIFDGTATTGDSTPVKAGDIFFLSMYFQTQNYTAGTNSRLAWFVNRSSWTEGMAGRILGTSGTQGIVFDHAAGGASSTGSFDRLEMLLQVDQSNNPAFPAVQWLNGANRQNGTLTINGNIGAATTPPTAAVINISGTSPAGTTDAGTPASFLNCGLYVGVECDGTAGQTGPLCLNLGAGNFVSQCYGALNYTGTPFGSAGGLTGSNFDFSGPINGAPGLANAYVMTTLDTSFANFFGSGPAGPSQVSADANNLLTNTDPSGLLCYFQQSQPCALTSVGSTTAETAIVTLPLPAAEVTPGAVFKLTGYLTAAISTTAPTITWRVRWGGVTGTLLLVTAAISETASQSGIWTFDAEVAFPVDDVTAVAALKLLYNLASTAETAGRYGAGTTAVAVESNGITVDTADPEDLVLTVQFSGANGQSVNCTGRAERVS